MATKLKIRRSSGSTIIGLDQGELAYLYDSTGSNSGQGQGGQSQGSQSRGTRACGAHHAHHPWLHTRGAQEKLQSCQDGGFGSTPTCTGGGLHRSQVELHADGCSRSINLS